jgi:hypothetical protein
VVDDPRPLVKPVHTTRHLFDQPYDLLLFAVEDHPVDTGAR